MRSVRSVVLFVLAAIAASLLMLSGALAHAGLISSDPADGTVLPSTPQQVVLYFTEPVMPLAFTLVSGTDERLSLDGAVSRNEQVTVPLPPELSSGTHLISWRVTSADGHPIGGSLVFSIGAPDARPSLTPSADPWLSGTIWLVRTALYVALFLAVGTAVFGAVIAPLPDQVGRIPLLAGLAGLLLAPLALGLQGLDALGVGFASLLSPTVWSTAASTSYGATLLVAALALSAAALSPSLASGRKRATVVAFAWCAAAIAPMLSGHAGTAAPTWLSQPAVALHIAGLIFWIGALLPLGVLLRSANASALEALRRFSRLIPLAIVPVVASGIVLGVLQMGLPSPVWLSAYAALLAAKLALLVPLFSLALWNRLALTHPTLAGAELERRRLRRSVGIELLLVLVVFAVVAGWRFTPPPRVIAELEARPAQTHIHTDAAMADVSVTSGPAGQSTMRVWLSDGAFAPLAPKALTIALSNAALGIERLQRPATLSADGYWETPLLLPSGGQWTIELDVRIDDFKLIKLTGAIELNP